MHSVGPSGIKAAAENVALLGCFLQGVLLLRCLSPLPNFFQVTLQGLCQFSTYTGQQA